MHPLEHVAAALADATGGKLLIAATYDLHRRDGRVIPMLSLGIYVADPWCQVAQWFACSTDTLAEQAGSIVEQVMRWLAVADALAGVGAPAKEAA